MPRSVFVGGSLPKDYLSNCSTEDYYNLFKISKKHDIAHLIAFTIETNGLLDESNDCFAVFSRELLTAVWRYEKMNYEYSERIGMRIKQARKAKKLTQEQLAELCDCTSTHISNIESGKIGLSIELLYVISRVLEKPMDYFVMDSRGADPTVKINSVIAPKLDQCDPEMLDVIDGFLDRMITYPSFFCCVKKFTIYFFKPFVFFQNAWYN